MKKYEVTQWIHKHPNRKELFGISLVAVKSGNTQRRRKFLSTAEIERKPKEYFTRDLGLSLEEADSLLTISKKANRFVPKEDSTHIADVISLQSSEVLLLKEVLDNLTPTIPQSIRYNLRIESVFSMHTSSVYMFYLIDEYNEEEYKVYACMYSKAYGLTFLTHNVVLEQEINYNNRNNSLGLGWSIRNNKQTRKRERQKERKRKN